MGAIMGEKQSEPKKNQVLVVGTTSDYIEWIERSVPDRHFF